MLHIIRRDVTSKFAGEFVSRSAFLLFFVIAGRKLGAADFGTLNLAISSAMILGILFFDPGLNMATVQRVIARPESASQDAGAVLAFKLYASIPLVLLALLLASAVLGQRLPSPTLLLLAGVYTGLYASLEYICYVTNAYHRIELEAAFKFLNRVLVVGFGFVGLAFLSVEYVLFGMCLATGISFLVAWFFVWKICVKVPLRWHTAAIKSLLKAGMPMAGTLIISAIYLKWDLILLTSFHIGREQIGWYASAFKCVEALSALPSMLGAALFPTLVQLRLEDPHKFSRLLRISVKLVLIIALPIALFVSAFSRPVVVLIYGSQFVPGAWILSVLIWCIVPMFLYFFLIWVNIAAGHASHNVYGGIAALATGLIVNMLLLPRVGYIGAAWAALFANIAFAMICVYKTSRLFRQAGIPSLLFQLFCTALLTAAALHYSPWPAMVRITIALGTYLLSMIVFRVLRRDDLSLAMRTIRLRSSEMETPIRSGEGSAVEPVELELR